MLGHNARAAAKDRPCEERADKGVADTDPGGRDTVLPAELSRVADEDYRGEIRCAVGECRQPRADASSAEHKAVYVSCVLAAVDADSDHYAEEQNQHYNFQYHLNN